MAILCFGVNFTAPSAVRGECFLADNRLEEIVSSLTGKAMIDEVIAFTTAQRTEYYLASRDATAARDALLGVLREANCLMSQESLRHAYTHRNEAAARHLFQVAAGIDAPVIGEGEVLTSIRGAHNDAMNRGACGEVLSTLVSRAIAFGDRLREDPEVGKIYLSVVSVALKLVCKAFGTLGDKRAVLIGEGENGKLLARQLQIRGVQEMSWLTSGGEEPPDLVDDPDIVVLAADWQQVSKSRAVLKAVFSKQRRDPGIVFDFGSEPLVMAGAPEVLSWTLKQLEAAARKNRAHGDEDKGRVEDLVEAEVERFMRWLNSARVRELVANLSCSVEELRQGHLKKYGKNLTEEQKEQLDEFTRTLLTSLLDDVTGNFNDINIESESGAKEYHLIQKLFNLRDQQRGDS